jgi:hypothetical protein
MKEEEVLPALIPERRNSRRERDVFWHVKLVLFFVMAVAACSHRMAPAPAPTPAATSVHLPEMQPGHDMPATLPEGWLVKREDAVAGVRAVILDWPGNALGLVVVSDDPHRRVLGTWVLAFGGLGVELTDWRMARDARDGLVHMHMTYVATYNNPAGEDGAWEDGAAEIASDGRTATLVHTDGYADFE